MKLNVKGRTVGAGTGGTVFDNAKPAVVFISGASLDHTVWAVPMRYFAQEGYGVLGPDMPEHGQSEGPPLATVEAMGEWLIDVLDAAGIETATLIGFSMGTYTALEAAARAPERVRKISLATATKVTCPVQLIVGEMDMMTPPKGAAKLAAELTEVETVGFAGCGHMTIAERPNETLDALRAFV